MDPITLILTALATGAAAGATTGATDTATAAIKDTYQALKTLIKKKFAGDPLAEATVDKHEKKPDIWKEPLKEALTEAQANKDADILKLAQQIIDMKQAQGDTIGTSTVIASGERSVAAGRDNFGSITTGDTHKP
ncbi:MAG TPA: hypothetical protein VEL31_24430 [Ktedonobacteraceae bacterium]|nr:hypothetical protein [Ktedonobacteraceae bacterium]